MKLFATALNNNYVDIIDLSNGSIVHQIYPPLSTDGQVLSVSADNEARYITIACRTNNGGTQTYIYKKTGTNSWAIDKYYV